MLCILVRLDLLYLGIAGIVEACILMYFGSTGIWICLHLETAGVVGMASVIGIFGFLFLHLGSACVFWIFSVSWACRCRRNLGPFVLYACIYLPA